jgi:CubicO group peptidase (beta-lactamase class C family)
MTSLHHLRVLSTAIVLSVLALAPAFAASAPGATGLPRARAEAAGLSAERLARLTPVLRGYVESGQAAGSVALVARRGRIVYHEAFGQADREAGRAMQTGSIFRIASQTKALVAVAAMQLVEQGKLALTDPLSRYVPEFRSPMVAVARSEGGAPGYDLVAARRPITIRHLLTHTSGIGYGQGLGADLWQKAGIQGWYFADRDEPVAATVARMGTLPLEAQPGEKWVYGYNIDILGVVVEKVSGLTLDEYLKRNILGPLRMNDTAFYVAPANRERFAAVYMRKDGGLERAPAAGTMVAQGAYVDGPRKAFSGGAGLTSTAADYARFLQMLLNGGELDGVRILSRKSVELMTADHLAGVPFQPGVGMGLGVSVVKDVGMRGEPGSVGEFGWGGAYHSTYWVDPKEQLVVVYLTQLIPAGDIDDFGRLRALVYQAIAD